MSGHPLRRYLGRLKRLILTGNPNPPPKMAWSELSDALRRIQAVAVDFGTVIDVGASDGQWTEVARTVYPAPKYVLIEACDAHREKLTAFAAGVPGAEAIFAGAADHDGEAYFQSAPDNYGGRVANEAREGMSAVPTFRLDTLARQRNWPAPYLIKLDTHGFEIPILDGASGILGETHGAIIEAYNFQLAPDSVRFHELCSYMEERGFRCFDVFDILHRKIDGALWQFDMVFLRADLPTLNQPGYQ